MRSITADKQALRKIIREKIDTITEQERSRASHRIAEFLLSMPEMKKAMIVGMYAALESEVSTSEIFSLLASRSKTVCLPRILGNDLSFASIRSMDECTPRLYQIPEPSTDLPEVYKNTIDLLIVPGIAFDWDNYRLGRGKGFYDRYLVDYTGISIGICFEIQRITRVPRESSDQPVKFVVTEDRVFG